MSLSTKILRRALVLCLGCNNGTLFILKSANLDVTVLCTSKILKRLGSSYDAWIRAADETLGESLESAMIRQVGALFANDPEAYDWVLYDDDCLLAALRDSDLDPSLKLRLSPVRAAQHLKLLHSKRETARFLREAGIPSARSASCDSFREILRVAREIGFPLLVKIEGTNGGQGVFRASSPSELWSLKPLVDKKKVLVERFLEGPTVAVEALFLSGELAAYNYSLLTKTDGPFGVSYERRFLPCHSMAATLRRLGRALQLNCFTNIGCILDEGSGTHFFVEVDLRPNAWVCYGRLVGVDFAAAIRSFVQHHDLESEGVLSTSADRVISDFARDVRFSLARRDWRRLLAWAVNRNHRWDTPAFQDFKRLRRIVWDESKTMLIGRLNQALARCKSWLAKPTAAGTKKIDRRLHHGHSHNAHDGDERRYA